jgi:hypothetical protein
MIGGPIDDDLAVEVTPRILELKALPEKPVILLVDSPGGRIDRTAQLMDLLFLEDRRGKRSPVLAVVTGHAQSAAADLVTAADFAAAFPRSTILCHGLRYFETELTEEGSLEHGTNLNRLNAETAKWLAARIFRRMLDTYRRVEPQFGAIAGIAGRYTEVLGVTWSSDVVDIGRLAAAIWRELPAGLDEIVDRAVGSMGSVSFLRREIGGDAKGIPAYLDENIRKATAERQADLRHGFRVLTALLGSRIDADPEFELDFETLVDVASEFTYYVESTSPQFEDEQLFATLDDAELFFGPKDLEDVTKIAERGDDNSPFELKRFDEIVARAYQRAEPLWAFSLGLARVFQHEEIELDPVSAWWLGLIDHVLGTALDRRLPPSEGPALRIAEDD